MKKALLGMVGAAAALGGVSAATAHTTTVTYFGVVTAGADVGGYFGLAGADLSNDAMALSYTYDTALGIESTDGMTYDEVDGGLDFGVSSPILSATLAVNGKSYSYTPDYYGDVQTGQAVFNWTDGMFDVTPGLSDTATSLSGASSSVVMQTDTASPLTSLNAAYASTGFGLAYFNTEFSPVDGSQDSFNLQISSATVAAAPEPAAWALMFAGIGAIGIFFRRRKRILNGVLNAA